MMERIKTYLLIGLVGLSIILTYQIWTYKPMYDYLLPTEYVTHEGIAERRELSDLIQPEKIVYYYGDERYTVSKSDSFEYANVIKQQMKNWSFSGFREVESNQVKQWDDLRTKHEGMELVYPTTIPMSTFSDLFGINTGEQTYAGASSIFLYINPLMNKVYAMFLNYDEQKMIRANTNINVDELRQYLALGENKPEFSTITFDENPNRLTPFYFVSDKPVQMTEYHYFSQNINVNTLIPYLFVDSSLVRQIQDRNGEIFFTDGTRGLQLAQQQNSMYYVHPVSESQTEPVRDQSIQRAVQFVNQHRGWESTFQLHDYHSPSTNEAVIEFRRYLNQYPVFSVNPEEDQNVIQLEVKDGRVIGYQRPLLQLDRVIEHFPKELPSEAALIEELQGIDIPLDEIQAMYVGYVYQYRETYPIFSPRWIIDWRNGERSFIRQIEDVGLLTNVAVEEKEEHGELE